MRYREMRWPCDYPLSVKRGDERMMATLINASSGGARLRMQAQLEPGEVVTLDLGSRQLAATVRWRRGELCGLRLLTPLSKPDLATIRRGREHTDAVTSGRWNTQLHEMR